MNGPSPRGNRNKIEISEKKKREEELGIKFDGNSFIILRSSEVFRMNFSSERKIGENVGGENYYRIDFRIFATMFR